MSKEEKEESKTGDGHADGAAAPKSKKKLIIIIAAALVLVGGGAGFFLMSGKKAADEHAETEDAHSEEERHLASAELPSFIVNLSETTNFLKVKLLVEYDPEVLAKAGGHAEAGGGGGGHEKESKGGEGLPGALGQRQPMIQDAVIRVLSAKKAADVLTVEGKENIKEELVEAINEASGMEEPPVVAVYFMEFIVQ
ncbi:MAG: flagellar basal body-associated FliL family protein [Deltaproteobacteria bacterium]|nr:flagellar basal body-associated FliL family protein [Deltaproteobacteria bacterium]